MFDFQKPEVYQKAKTFNREIADLLRSRNFDRVTNDRLRRAYFSKILTITITES